MSKINITYQINFFDYWHTSSGLSASTYADTTVHKDKGLPFIPGRTLKGMLRDAAEQLYSLNVLPSITQEFIDTVFGEAPPIVKRAENQPIVKEDAIKRKISVCNFSNATISPFLKAAISEKKQQHLLYHTVASTAIDELGIAKDETLRQLEITVPLTLYASITDLPESYEASLKLCMQWIKRMGLNRTRGLGRCEFSVVSNTK